MKNQKGMTLIETLILFCVAAIVILIALPVFKSGPSVKYSKETGCTNQVQQSTQQPQAKPQGF